MNSYIHGITSHMVSRPDVPRMEDLIPLLIQYARSRQISGKPILWVAHNSKRFDVPIIISEFQRCSVEIPSDWLFVDTLPLARQLANPDEESLITGERWELRKSKWLKDLDEEDVEENKTLSSVLQSDSRSGLIKVYDKRKKSVQWGDQFEKRGFSIGAKPSTSSLTIGPGPGYNLETKPLVGMRWRAALSEIH